MAKPKKKSQPAAVEEGPQVTLEEALKLAQGHHQCGNFVLAERTYKDILRAVPDHYPTTQYLGVLLFQNQDHEGAAYYLKKAVEAESGDSGCWNNYGGVLTELGRYEEAMEAYDKALKIDPKNTDALTNQAYTLELSGKSDEAEKAARKILKQDPENLDALVNLGTILAKRGDYKDALEIWKNAADINPDMPSIWLNWGNTLRDVGMVVESEQKCRKALDLEPDNAQALNNLGNALREQGKFEEAEECYVKSTNIKPDYFEAHNNRAIVLMDQFKYEDAAIAARYAVAFNKEYAEGYGTLSVALREQGDFPAAMLAAQRSVALLPDKAEPYLDLAEVLFKADRLDDADAALQEALKREDETNARGYLKLADIREHQTKIDEAIEAIEKAIELEPHSPMLWMRKAQIYQINNQMDQAFESIDKAIELAPGWPAALANKAEMLINVNENEQAEKLSLKALEGNPDLAGAYGTLISLRKVKSEDDEKFQKLVSLQDKEESMGLRQAAAINYALSSGYEQFKNYEAAFEHLQRANEYRRKSVPYEADKVPETYEFIKKNFSPEVLKHYEGKGYKSDVPIFILGMPRSGTTLTEQIISSHSQVFGAGELAEIGNVRETAGVLGEDTDVKALGKDYVERLKTRDKNGKAKRITDKMPGNYLNIGFIVSILPDAKIIHCGRNPIDTCLSCYKQNFARGQYWSYDLEELAAEYKRYEDMMAYWRQVLPGRFLEIDYEETVSNFEEQARKLIDYVGLDWEDACLEPHKQKRTVLTASKAQVTQPVYKTSVDKWKRYEKQLQPLVRELLPDQALKDTKKKKAKKK